MTERLYYDDAYLTEFDGEVTEVRADAGEVRIALDRSAFYPTSGGQPYDTGTLSWGENTVRVTDVEVDRNGIVWHRTDREIPAGTKVRGRIDAERRLDHMEQHGGEHMLAGAVWEKFRGITEGLHLGKNDSTIDVEMPDGRTRLTDDEVEMLEDTVNARIRADAPIRCWFPDAEELARLPLRKPPTVKEHVRIVAMGDFEMVACGGTHPASTGRIGQIKILSALPSRGKIRFTFVCGRRAEKVFQETMRAARKAGNVLSCPAEKIASSAGELQARLGEAERKLNRFETEEALKRMIENEDAESLPGIRLSAARLEEGDARPVAEAVSRYIAEEGRILLLSVGERLTFARSADVDADMNELIRRVARGGGRPDLAGGAGVPECVDAARKILMTEGKGKSWRKKI